MAIRIVLTYIALKVPNLKNCTVEPADPFGDNHLGKLIALCLLKKNLSKLIVYRLHPEMTNSLFKTSKIYYNYVYD